MNAAAEDLLVQVQIREACELAGHPELADRIELRWSRRMSSTLGKANRTTFEITLASRAWALISVEERRDTVFHEVAHLVAFLEVGIEGWGHGLPWRCVMRRIGAKPERCADREVARAVASLRRKVARHVASCACTRGEASRFRLEDGSHLLTLPMARKLGAGRSITCRDCRHSLELSGHTVKVS